MDPMFLGGPRGDGRCISYLRDDLMLARIARSKGKSALPRIPFQINTRKLRYIRDVRRRTSTPGKYRPVKYPPSYLSSVRNLGQTVNHVTNICYLPRKSGPQKSRSTPDIRKSPTQVTLEQKEFDSAQKSLESSASVYYSVKGICWG
jgi:hypothetical protein